MTFDYEQNKTGLIFDGVEHCRNRNVAGLDEIFDTVSDLESSLLESQNREVKQLLMELIPGIATRLLDDDDIESVSWFFSYMTHEINTQEDNAKPQPMAELCSLFATLGMKPFFDFFPVPNRFVVNDVRKIEGILQSLPDSLGEPIKSLLKNLELERYSPDEQEKLISEIREQVNQVYCEKAH